MRRFGNCDTMDKTQNGLLNEVFSLGHMKPHGRGSAVMCKQIEKAGSDRVFSVVSGFFLRRLCPASLAAIGYVRMGFSPVSV